MQNSPIFSLENYPLYKIHKIFNCYIISGFWNSLESKQLEEKIKNLSIEKEQLKEALKTSEEEKGIHYVH